MRTLIGIYYILLLAFLIQPVDSFAEGFSGTIYFRNGESVFFDHIGDTVRIYKTEIDGKFGAKTVKYRFEDFKEVIFADKNCSYNGVYSNNPTSEGTIIVINRQGERFTLTNCEVEVGGLSRVTYTYNDPITKSLRVSSAEIQEISHVIIGEDMGDMKYNPKTKEYFPAMYIFDPFTGEKLVWVNRK